MMILFKQAIVEMMHHKLRTLLTLLGMVFGVGAVIAMLSIGEGAKVESTKLIESMGLRNLVINERRKDARRKRILSDNLTDVLLSTSSVAEDEDLEMGDTAMAKLKALRECIGGLPEKSLLMLKSRYENENSAHEIAEEFEMKPPAVRKALERVRTALRKCMEEKLTVAVSA